MQFIAILHESVRKTVIKKKLIPSLSSASPVPFLKDNVIETSLGSGLLFCTVQMNTPVGKHESWKWRWI